MITTPKTISQIAQSLLYLDGTPFSLKDYPMYETIYNGRYKRTLLMCGRQVAKSTSLANFIISESISEPFFKEYYVSPSKEQTLIFSNTRVGKTLSYSPLVKKYFQSPEHADRVLHRSYTNGSENAFTYACDDADRARGFSADRVSYDEVQDMLYDAVIPVINACMKNSKWRFETYAGTPKTMEASIQYLWDHSTKSEWCMKCDGCAKYNFVGSTRSMGLHGPICLNCGKTLNPRQGLWIDMQKPQIDPKTNKPEDLIKGFHIPQPIMPMNIPLCYPNDTAKQEEAQKRWDDILTDMNRYSESKFKNEVLGVSDAQGRRLISLEELRALCVGPNLSEHPNTNNMRGVSRTFRGVDWSGGGTKGISRTVLWIWGEVPEQQKLRCLYYRIYPGTNAVDCVDHIARVCSRYNVSMTVGDAGEGFLANSVLRQRLGMHRVTAVRYGSAGHPIFRDGQYRVNRTELIDTFLLLLKRQGAVYAPYPEMQEAIKDVLNVFEEVTTSGKKVWQHSPDLPDDSLHAQIFGWFAWRLVIGDLKFYG